MKLPRRLLLLVLGAVLCPTVFAQTLTQLQGSLNLKLNLPTATAQSKGLLDAGNPKVAPALRGLLLNSQSKGIGELTIDARAKQITIEDNRIAVVAAANSEDDVDALRARIEADGGTVTAIVDEAILARIPVRAVDRIGAEATLEYLAPQSMLSLPPIDLGQRQAPATSPSGVLLTKANLMHAKGIRGKGMKVGILDFGFTGYQALQKAGVVPEPRAVKAFGKDQGWDRINKGTPHGAACAEIIHAMAPDAGIYIAAIGDGEGGASQDEIIRAAMWLADQKVDVISFSGGGHGGPHNGTDLLDKLVEQIVGKGILWVNASGNEGDSHWSTTTRLNAENLVLAGDKPFLLVQSAGAQVAVQVSWDDWGSNPLAPTSTQDFDVFLASVDTNTGAATIVADSQQRQNGRAAPLEIVAARSRPGQVFAVFILAAKASHPVRMHVYTLTPAQMVPDSAEGSVGIPATSPFALAVGAVNVGTQKLEGFSSQGPTDDGRSKPEVSAPDGVFSEAYRLVSPKQASFLGTSAACPHVSGFAALMLEAYGKSAPADMIRRISEAVTPLADNRGAGRGLIDASKIKTQGVTTSNPRPGESWFSDAFRQADDNNSLGVKVVVGREQYRIGDGLKIGYRSNRDANCLLIHHSSDGVYTPLQPSDGDQLRLTAGERYAFPTQEGTIQVTGPPGFDDVGLICSSSPLGLETFSPASLRDLSVSVVRYQVAQ